MTKRVIPWALPSIKGGSVGGYTPAPTPTPPEPESTDPYDFSDVVISMSGTLKQTVTSSQGPLQFNSLNGTSVTVSSIKALNVSDVGSVIVFIHVDKDDYTVSLSNLEGTKQDLTIRYDISSVAGMQGGTKPQVAGVNTGLKTKSVTSSTTKTLTATISNYTTSIKVYNASGVLLQEWEPEPEPEPEA